MKPMFQQLVVSGRPKAATGSAWPTSLIAHGGALAIVTFLSLLNVAAFPAPIDVREPSVPTVWVPRSPAGSRAENRPAPRSEPRPQPSQAPRAATAPAVPLDESVELAPLSTSDGKASAPEAGELCVFCPESTPAGAGPASGEGSDQASEGGSGPTPRAVRAHVDVRAPTKVHHVAPVYPAIAVQARAAGVVIVECTIDPHGQVVDTVVLRGHQLLDAAALTAIRQWRYTPTLLNGVPVPVVMTVTVQFQLH